MSNLATTEQQVLRLGPIEIESVQGFAIQNNLGEGLAGIGLLLRDPAIVSTVSIVAAGLSPILFGPVGIPLAVGIGILGVNDCKHLHSRERRGNRAIATVEATAEPVETIPQTSPEPAQKAVGTTTKLNAIPAQAKPVIDTQTALSTLIVASPFTSRAVFGAQRTGKSYLVAVATRHLASTGINIFHLNLASYGDEDDRYWTHAAASVRCDLSEAPAHVAADAISRAIALVERFYSTENSILIVDEWAYIGSINNGHAEKLAPLLHLLADKIATLASTGMKRRRALWTISPEFVAGSLTQDAKAVKKLALCLVAIAPGRSVDWQGMTVGFNAELFAQIKNNYPVDMPTVSGALAGHDRIAYINGEWCPVGVDAGSLGTVPARSVAIATQTEPTEPDPDVVAVARAQVQTQQFTDELKANYQNDEAMRLFVDWLAKNQGESISYEQFKNSNAFRKVGRSQTDWARLTAEAFALGLIVENSHGGFDVVVW